MGHINKFISPLSHFHCPCLHEFGYKTLYRMRFNVGFIFHGFAIFVVFAFLNSWLLDTMVLKYSGIYGVSLYTIVVYSSCRDAKLAGLVGFVWRCHRIEWRAAPHGHQSALFSCSHARSVFPFFPYSLHHRGRNNILQIWHDVTLGYQVRMNRHVCWQHEQQLGNKGTSEARLPRNQLLLF